MKLGKTYLLRNGLVDAIGLDGALAGGGFHLYSLYRLGGRIKQVSMGHRTLKMTLLGRREKGALHSNTITGQRTHGRLSFRG